MAMDPRHDCTVLDNDIVTEATIASRSQSELSAGRSALPPPYPPSSLSQATMTPSSAKRFHPYDQSSRQPKSVKLSQRCFRCGATGHMSAVCDSKLTSAGLPCPSWSKRPGSRSGALRDDASGRLFCLAWEQSSDCRFSDRCKNLHKCSICGDREHGANACHRC